MSCRVSINWIMGASAFFYALAGFSGSLSVYLARGAEL
jgi:hypothetical protein